MASRGVATVAVFYVTEDGVVLGATNQSSDDADVSHGVEESRVRLATILRNRKVQQQETELLQQQDAVVRATAELEIGTPNPENDDDGGTDESSVHSNQSNDSDTDVVVAPPLHRDPDAALLRLAPLQPRSLGNRSLVDREAQLRHNRLLARSANVRKGNNSTKAIASQFVHKESPADNAARRAVVHHTGSHYVMAGGVQFQRGLRVPGVVSRHSKQGAKLQAARMALQVGSA